MKCAKSKHFATKLIVNFFWFCVAWLFTAPLYAYQASDFSWIPPFQSQDEKPSIHIIFDNSGSMNDPAYTATFSASQTYYGPFKSSQNYIYSNNQFKETNNTSNIWSGNFLNWAAATRADVAKKVMTGGRHSNGVLTLTPSDRTTERTINTTLSQNKFLVPTTHQDKTSLKITRDKNNADPPKISVGGTSYTLKIEQEFEPGVIQKFKDSARMSLFFYNDILKSNNEPQYSGGFIQAPLSDAEYNINLIIQKINDLKPNTWTPLAESLYTVIGYISQSNNNNNGPRYASDKSYPVNDITKDPFYFSKYKDEGTNGLVYCTKQNVILITDGESTKDGNIPSSIQGLVSNSHNYGSSYFASGGTKYLLDVAYYGHTTDLRSGDAFPGKQTIDLYTVFAFGSGSNFLKDATMYGSFKSEAQLSAYKNNIVTKVDNYFEAQSGDELEEAVFSAFASATAATASGSAVAVSPQSQEGDGAVFQAVFFPPTDGEKVAPPWSGHVHALFLDDDGNLRESNNENSFDKSNNIIQFDGGKILRINPSTNSSTQLNSVLDINSIWSSTAWLNSDSLDVTQQRAYNSTQHRRFIFTFVDKNQNMVPSSTAIVANGDVQPFVLENNFSFDTNNTTHFSNYLTLRDGAFDQETEATDADRSNRTKDQVKYIRGADLPNNVSGSEQVRSRKLTPGSPTWRLGDIIYSSPTLVAAPAENYNLYYFDWDYGEFYQKYKNRRQVVYVGSNDGMLHAFNAGFYDRTAKKYVKQKDSETPHELGAELWAYIPYNLLPHLRWLMNANYGEEIHVSYMDLEPRVFDVRIFEDSETHPKGWGTILVAGMRLGGATIQADIDKDGVPDRTMSSAYVIMDVTDPEQEPRLLAEVSLPHQGFTTCQPAVMPMTTPNAKPDDPDEWFLVFGSGPANRDGEAAPELMETFISKQQGRLFVLDLKQLVASVNKGIRTLDSDGTFKMGQHYFAKTESDSFIADPVVVDFDRKKLNGKQMKADVVYFGTAAGGQTDSSGILYRLVVDNEPDPDPDKWKVKPLINIGQPITAPVTTTTDTDHRFWVYFGTGRYFNLGDVDQEHKRGFFGVKEPIAYNEEGRYHSWGTVSLNSLYDSSKVTISGDNCAAGVYTKSCVRALEQGGETMSWSQLVDKVRAEDGWKQEFSPARERVVDKASILAGRIFCTSYIPNLELCKVGGESNLWGFYYMTGTEHFIPIFSTTHNSEPFISLGEGKASRPYIQINKGDASGTTAKGRAMVSMSDGSIKSIEITTDSAKQSQVIFWRELRD